MEYVTPLCSVLALVLAYFAISREGRTDLKDSLRKVLTLARRGLRPILMAVIIVGPALISWSSYTNVAEFRDSVEPVTRREIVSMLLHAFNFGMYLIFCMAGIGIVIGMLLQGRKRRKNSASELEEDVPSEEGVSG
ncbi:hypothetical protein H681_12415 [Pseudomonas sp. ATCC 13867]|uniref:hypothetical protein n=1 Tax=Pseudomonas sp. ATCC 13867 TaxID=1294143 RepID=UPI0002C4F597|nr:hypothetical protein [Pseudomonas sp. ATCC 13867]AGI24353.1 hypothetical protein H681_12415 [Pseudomonas sp. ATCC 13867]RFQ15854.1 hypothetical protein D0N87_27315 [Pseudomonas sp. ATCC 13867]